MRKPQTKILVVLMAMLIAVSSVTACSTPKEVSVSFVVDSQVTSVIKTAQKGNVELPEDPTKTGYTFNGWYLDEGIWQNEFTAQTSVSKDTSVYAKFSLTEFVATFKADGEVVDAITFTIEDSSITPPQVPKKGGYIGTWEDYTLGANEITVNAVYTVDPNGLMADEVDGILLNDLVNNFLYDGNDKLLEYTYTKLNGKEVDYSKPKAVELSWENKTNTEISEYTVYLSENEDLSNAKTYTVSDTSLSVKNLKTGTKYFWKVVSENFESIINCFETQKVATRLIDVDGITNFRDVGGYSIGNGKSIAQGQIYRCAAPNTITAEGLEAIKDLGIKTEIDLRATSENSGKQTGDKSFLGDDVNYVFCPIGYSAINYSIEITEALKVTMQSVFEVLANEENYPVVFHCSAGADRTGFLAYALQAILGADVEDIHSDYLLTNFSKQAIVEYRRLSLISKFTNAVNAENGTTLSEKMENYLINVWGISKTQIDSIRTLLTADIDTADWKACTEPETYNYSVKVYMDNVDKTSEFTLLETTAKAYTLVDITTWANENTPKDYALNTTKSVLQQRITENGKVEFSVYYEVIQQLTEVLVGTKEQFVQALSDFYTAGANNQGNPVHIKLTADIIFADTDNPIYPAKSSKFYGIIDGCGYSVQNLKINVSHNSYANSGGLFSSLYGTIQNIAFINVKLDNSTWGAAVGVICGTLQDGGAINNVFISGNVVSSSNTGGIVRTNKGTISNCIVALETNSTSASSSLIDQDPTSPKRYQNCYGISNTYKMISYYWGGTKYASATDFLSKVTSLSATNGWSSYWKIENGALSFGNNVVLGAQ